MEQLAQSQHQGLPPTLSHAINEARQLRLQARSGQFSSPTSGYAAGLAQGNVVILSKKWADDFLLFCQNNPIPCPLLHVSAPGSAVLHGLGHNIDIRTDVPEYHIFRHGKLVERVQDIQSLWSMDMVCFVLGCSFSFEDALLRDGLPLRNIECQRNVSMFRTNIKTQPSQYFSGELVVSMRPFKPADAIRAIQITSRFPKAHGAPIHLGDPAAIGIHDLSKPDFGDPVPMNDGEVPLFWACGVTPQLAIESAKPPIAITHAPGKMLITELSNDQLSVL